MKILKEIKVPTGEIYTAKGDKGVLEFLTVADYGKDANIKADFLGITRELNGVPNGKPMPVIIKDVIIGKATPNKEQLAEMNRTAKMVQAKQTQEREYEVQVAREKAERQKAVADKAYMSEMNLNPQQFIQLKWVETVAQKQGANIDVLVGPAEHMWNIKR